ncbi:MAG TPA: hypothetical protein VGG87_12490 [Solirubrobacteraceae bacterium]
MTPRSHKVSIVALSGLLVTAALVCAACGGAGSSASGRSSGASARGGASVTSSDGAPRRVRRPAPPAYPHVLAAAGGTQPTDFVPAVRWRGQTAVWVARRSGVALLSFNQRLVELRLHSGTVDAGASGWRYGPSIVGRERHRLVGVFNGGFKLDTGSGGFTLGGRTAVALTRGLGSIVTYSSGLTDVGAWQEGVPASGQAVTSVRQNLDLLVSGGRPASNLACVRCWGATLGGVAAPARSALGVTRDGRLIWAGGENLTPAGLAAALVGANVQRAVELDINPEWVAAYLYGHHRELTPVPIVPGQPGVPGQFLAPYSRDFFTVVAR